MWCEFINMILGTPSSEPIKPLPTVTLSDLSDKEVVARTIYGEARGEGIIGMQAVACVIQNRARIGGWYGKSPREVCLRPFQFSCWNRTDPNRAKLLSIPPEDQQYQDALTIADRLLSGMLLDITCDADSYEVRGTNAYWAKGLTPVASIGKHEFYCTRG